MRFEIEDVTKSNPNGEAQASAKSAWEIPKVEVYATSELTQGGIDGILESDSGGYLDS